MSDDDRPVESPPEGASCAEHPEREALVTCPRCGSYCCITCWHGAVRRCHACVLREPGPPVPWEDRERGFAARFFGTLTDAFRPTRSAPSFVHSEWRSALSFTALTFLPVALVAGIIPFTHTLVFGAGQVRLVGTPSEGDIAIDAARAAALGLLVAGAKLLCLAVPYHSLTQAYASRGNPPAALSLMLYRGWLVPFAELLLGVLTWAVPGEPSANAFAVVWAASLVPLIVLISSMLATARMASGVGPVAALVVVLVPFVVMMVFTPIGLEALTPWLPDSESIRRAVEPGAS